MDRLKIQATGFPGTTETWKFIKNAYEKLFEGLGQHFGGDDYIISGVQVSGSNVSGGFIVHKGELLPFVGGTKTNTVVIMEEVTSVEYNTDITNQGQLESHPTYFKRWAQCGSPGQGVDSFDFDDLIRLDDYDTLQSRINVVETKVNPATESNRGIIELATQSEVDHGTDSQRAITPKTLTGASHYRKVQATGSHVSSAGHNGSSTFTDGIIFTINNIQAPYIINVMPIVYLTSGTAVIENVYWYVVTINNTSAEVNLVVQSSGVNTQDYSLHIEARWIVFDQ